jgi:hypothetical protein
MIRRLWWAAAVAVAVTAAPVLAQSPAGWRVHTDPSQNAQDPDNTPNLTFAAMGKGFHVVSGPAGTFWHPSNTASGSYVLRATFNLMEPSNHTNYYGLVFGGRDLEGPNQSYAYFVVAQDGTFQVRQRNGRQVTTVLSPSVNAAVRRPGANGQSVNALEVRVAGDTVSYVVNGTVVQTGPKGSLNTDGLTGVRVNHVLNVHVEGFAVGK